jgi:hypothetical protein
MEFFLDPLPGLPPGGKVNVLKNLPILQAKLTCPYNENIISPLGETGKGVIKVRNSSFNILCCNLKISQL